MCHWGQQIDSLHRLSSNRSRKSTGIDFISLKKLGWMAFSHLCGGTVFMFVFRCLPRAPIMNSGNSSENNPA